MSDVTKLSSKDSTCSTRGSETLPSTLIDARTVWTEKDLMALHAAFRAEIAAGEISMKVSAVTSEERHGV